jgi:hypothetical protein
MGVGEILFQLFLTLVPPCTYTYEWTTSETQLFEEKKSHFSNWEFQLCIFLRSHFKSLAMSSSNCERL